MSDIIVAVRKRLALGEIIDGDLSWCRQRLRALNEWPVPLDFAQQQEIGQLHTWIEEYGE